MSMIDWEIEGLAFGNCNCDWTCPCQFELRPVLPPSSVVTPLQALG